MKANSICLISVSPAMVLDPETSLMAQLDCVQDPETGRGLKKKEDRESDLGELISLALDNTNPGDDLIG